ncbi:MAG: group II intron reverse transcriptase/maturase [Bacteriovoracaceae bacterium]|nr:group II intron reverse transcriptase/maturase [Candidatus Brocadiales bacterium]MBL6991880.1 group II intron reverse transcriptase/maturase [Bacteriovoracaceae bacterium]
MRTNSKLKLIAEKARKDKGFKFSSLAHLINEESLSWCYGELKTCKAPGIDGVGVLKYGENLDENLKDLVERMKTKKYRPQPVKRVLIPKPGKKEKRGLGIPTAEDKLVQVMMKKILEAIFEQDFVDFSYGFRPKRSCHQAVKRLNTIVMKTPVNLVVDVDIEKFFDNISHYWLLRCLEEKISDPNFLLLVRRFLKAGIWEDGIFSQSKVGTPQGGVISPILANIYLHYVLDIWFERKFKLKSRARIEMIRYCDDFIVCCESKKDAEDFIVELEDRLAKFNLNVSKAKTSIVRFGRAPWSSHNKGNGDRPQTFNFLGFTHYCGKSKRGYFLMGHKTQKEKLRKGLIELNTWLKKIRNSLLLKDWWKILRAKLVGHYNYFGVSGNIKCLRQFEYEANKLIYKWINRRSQKRSMTWETFSNYLDWNPLPQPRIHHDFYTR